MATKSKKSTPIVEVEETYMPDADETITFKRSHFYSALVVLAFGVGLMLGYVLWGRGAVVAAVSAPVADQPSAAQDQPSGPLVVAPTAEPQPPSRYDIPVEGYPSFGPDDAPITIVEFSDFQCPFCSRFYEQTYRALQDSYPGQIRFVYRNLPLSFHINAFPAAEAALCAGDQGAYWDMHDTLFENQVSLNNPTNTKLEQSTYNQYASELGLDVDAFEECMTTRKYEQFILDDISFSQSIGVQATPTFFINGLKIEGAHPLPNFTQLIDQELAGEIP